MKRTLLLALLCLLPSLARAQVGPISITSAECATIAVGSNVSTIAINVSGTWTGTLQPQVSIQGKSAANVQVTPSTSSTAQSTVTANGVYTAAVAGYDTFLLCGATVASGTAVVNLNNSVARRGGTGSGGSGTVTSVATTSPIAGGTITATGTITCTTCLTATTPTNHGVLLGAGSQAVGATSAGTAGNVLTSNGASADPTFQAATGGALVQLETHAASTSASLAFTTCISGSTYHEYVVSFRNIVPATNTTHILLQVSTNGGSSYDTGSNYGWGAWRASGGGATQAGATTDTSIGLDGSGGISSTASKGGFVGRFSLYDPLNGAQFTRIKGEFGANDDGGTVADVVSMIAGSYKVTTAVNAFRIIATTGNLTSGTVTCYGLTP